EPILNRDTQTVAAVHSGESVYVLSHVPAGTIRVSGFDPNEKPRTGTGDILLTKCDRQTGLIAWRYVFDSPEHGEETPTILTVAENGNLLIGGYTDAGKSPTGRVWGANDANHLLVLTVSPGGDLLWTARWRSEVVGVADPPSGLVAGKSGAVYAFSRLFIESGRHTDAVLVKFVPGRVAWVSRFAGEGTVVLCEPGGIVVDAAENITVCGAMATPNMLPVDDRLLLAQYSPEGKKRWLRRFFFGDKGQTGLHLLVRDPVDGSFFAAGASGVVRFDVSGATVWQTEAGETFARNAAAIVRPERLALSKSGDLLLLYRPPLGTPFSRDTSRVMRFEKTTGAMIPSAEKE
ncbi:MAG: hypothetical protein H7145_06300, partial [Akkermansiaceae bacterium]|nr:hypothetical protein [Armatimonadota bacterium]